MLRRKMATGLIWNYAAFGVLAVSGVLINVIVAARFGVEGLGVFNQIYAVYVLTSQFAVGGVHYSALKHVAEHAEAEDVLGRTAWSAIGLALLLGVTVAGVVYVLSGVIGVAMDSPLTGRGLAWAAPGLAFFSVNKVLLAVLNGLRHMRAYAVGQALRSLLMIAIVIALTLAEVSPLHLGAVFSVAEAVLAAVLLPLVARAVPVGRRLPLDRDWLVIHGMFGLRAFMSGVAMEINARVDVLMLSLFASDSLVGIYSFAAMLGEGIYNLLTVVRNNVNPLLVALIRDREPDEVRRLIGKTHRYVYPGMAVVVLVVLLGYGPAIQWVYGESELLTGWLPLAILCGGILVASGYVPFDTILVQGGRPGRHALLTGSVVATNVLLNAMLIPPFGIYGAAMGTAGALAFSVLYLKFATKRYLGISLGLPLLR